MVDKVGECGYRTEIAVDSENIQQNMLTKYYERDVGVAGGERIEFGSFS